jgi:hypothetical protein
MLDIEETLQRVLQGNTTNDHLGSLEGIEQNMNQLTESLTSLLILLRDKKIISDKDIEEKIAPSFLWDYKRKYK